MASGKRDAFERELENLEAIDDPDVYAALTTFADALDPEDHHVMVPRLRQNGSIDHETKAHTTGLNYVKAVRLLYERGLDVLAVDEETVNDFMKDLVTEPDRRRYDLVDYDGSLAKTSAKQWQSAIRSFYRFCTEPGVSGDRPDVNVEWPVDEITTFTTRSVPKHDEEYMPEQADLDALREACVSHSLNTRRDRAFIELAAGTGQRVYALVTLKVKHANPAPDNDIPHVLLNPEIKNDGDKGAIENTGRWKPIVTDPGPVAQWIEHHPLQDPDVRAEHGAPEDFGECYLFIGDVSKPNTDASTHWYETAPIEMLNRRKANTADMPNVKTVDIPVNPHNWRHYAYTKSKELPIDESIRRKVFGWARGSDTGEKTYGHGENKRAGEAYAKAWAEAFGDGSEGFPGVSEQVLGTVAAGELPPETRRAIVEGLMGSDEFVDAISEIAASATE